MSRQDTILIVDDDRLSVSVAREMCEKAGYKVIEANDGIQGLRIAQESKPDLVLLDIMMPGKDGFEVCMELRANPETADMPVLMLTGLQDIENMATGFELGANDYIIKPVRAFELRQRIGNLLKARNYRKTLQDMQDGLPEGDEVDNPARISGFYRFKYALEYELKRTRRFGHEFSCVSLLLDAYDRTLEEEGKKAAASLVGATTGVLKRYLRSVDRMYRIGDREFVLLLPETPKSGARVAIERLRKALKKPSLENVEAITVTAVLVTVPMEGVEDAEDILDLQKQVRKLAGEEVEDCVLEPAGK
jgi:diguanylate cyclase (GGDEF)-like protein